MILENVPQFTKKLLHELFGLFYHISAVVLDPMDAGYPIERRRRYTILILKTAPMHLSRPLADVVGVLGRARHPPFTMDSVFVLPHVGWRRT